MRLHYPTVPDAWCGMSLITIAILVLHLLVPAHAESLKDAQDSIKAFRKDWDTFTPRSGKLYQPIYKPEKMAR